MHHPPTGVASEQPVEIRATHPRAQTQPRGEVPMQDLVGEIRRLLVHFLLLRLRNHRTPCSGGGDRIAGEAGRAAGGEAALLRLDCVARIASGLHARVEDPEPDECRGRQQRLAGNNREAATAPAEKCPGLWVPITYATRRYS